MPPLAIDFETAYSKDYSVADMGSWAYCHDPRFDPYLVAMVGDDGFSFVGHPSAAPWEKAARYPLWISHNAGFDEQVFLAARARGDFQSPSPARWLCTADLCAYLQRPRALADAVNVEFGEVLDKSIRDRMAADHQGDLWRSAPTKAEVDEYALQDARLCLRLWQTLGSRWPEQEQELSTHTRMMGQEGISFDRAAAITAGESLRAELAKTEQEIPWTASGKPPSSRNELFAECARLGILPPATTAEKSPEFQAWIEQYEPSVPWVRCLNKWRKINRLIKVLDSMLLRTDGNNRLHYGLRYYGAAITGRWSGADGLNLQNLNRDAEGVDLRGLLIPKPGHVFVISDLSQIEPRVLAVLVNDEKMLSFLRSGADLYEAHARATMGYSDPRPLADVDKNLRSLAKARVLGLGYGCGAAKFVAVAKMMAGLDITADEAERTVNDFRESNPLITNYWAKAQAKFSQASGKPFWSFKLQSERAMRYFNPDKGTATPVKGKERKKFYGGLFVENIVQATARDVLAGMVLAAEAAGLPVVLHVHDEIIIEVPQESADESLQTLTRIMSTPPDWMPTLPLACEAKITTRYLK